MSTIIEVPTTNSTIVLNGVETNVIEVITEGPQGPQGAQGAQGVAGQGVPAAGTAGQILEKIDGADYNTKWADVADVDLSSPPPIGNTTPNTGGFTSLTASGTMTAEIIRMGDTAFLYDTGGDLIINNNGGATKLRFNGGDRVKIFDASIHLLRDAELTGNLTTSGNVGIGTTTPVEKLDVVGNIKASGAVTIETGLAVKTQTTGITGADQVTNMISLTLAEYNAIGSPDAATLYIIK